MTSGELGRRVVATAVVALVLVGCSTARPGAAVVVDDTVVSMSDVDEAAEIICRLSLAQQPDGSFPTEQIRAQAVTELALAVVADDVAENEGLQVTDSDVRVPESDRRVIAQRFPDLDTQSVVDVLETSARVSRIAQLIGSETSGEEPSLQNGDSLQQIGRAALVEALGRADAEFSPRFELGDLAEQVRQPSSLSVSAASGTEEDTADEAAQPLLDTRTCAS